MATLRDWEKGDTSQRVATWVTYVATDEGREGREGRAGGGFVFGGRVEPLVEAAACDEKARAAPPTRRRAQHPPQIVVGILQPVSLLQMLMMMRPSFLTVAAR